MSETIVREYYTDLFDAKLVIIGTHHQIDYQIVLEKLEEYNFDSVCCEIGLSDGLDDRYPEHKSALEYADRYDCQVNGVDVQNIEDVVREPHGNADESGLDADRYTKAAKDDYEDADEISENDIWEHLAETEASYPDGYMFFMRLRNQNIALDLKKQLEKHSMVAMIVGSAHVLGILEQLEWSMRE